MSTLSFPCAILVIVKKIGLTPLRAVFKWTLVKATLKLLTALLWVAILSMDLKFTVMAVTGGSCNKGGHQ